MRFGLAQRFVPALTASNAKPVYVDCNAINPMTVERVAAAIAPTGAPFVDAGIIGGAAEAGATAGPRFYASGPAAPRFAVLRDYGLDIRVLDGAVERGFGAENVLCRHHQGHPGDRRGDDPCGGRKGSAEALLRNCRRASRRCFPGSSGSWRRCRRRRIAGSPKCRRSRALSATTRRRASSMRVQREFFEQFANDFEKEGLDAKALGAFFGDTGARR